MTYQYEVGKRGAVHIHMVLSGIDARKLRGIWKYGYVTMKPMDPSGQYSRLASYFLKYFQKTRETDRQIQKHAYNPSRNLSRPEPRKEKISAGTFRRKVREPKGWYIDKQVAPDNGGIRYGITEDGYSEILPVSLSPSQDLQFSADIPHGNDPAVPS